jgi:hypothetical protein
LSNGSHESGQESHELLPYHKVATDEPTTKDFETIVGAVLFAVLSIGA